MSELMKITVEPSLVLQFADTLSFDLWGTCFSHPLLSTVCHAVRGKTHGAYRGCGSFEWSRGVRAMALLMVNALQLKGHTEADLVGGTGSLAASLDYALDKQPAWMSEIFGVDSSGNSLLRRIVLRSNPGRKRRGPVALSVNIGFLPLSAIRIRVGETPIDDVSTLDSICRALTMSESEDGVSAPDSKALQLFRKEVASNRKAAA